ncbi:DUF91 domain-containing protein [Vibrio parahaemolyticus]|nr:DUF91 domain-containing protein [Vibrio parahaemolyticus]
MSESKIRDNLASNLSIIDDSYHLVETEHFLPNTQGTRGFIDILATNAKNQHIIIEIKRTNTSSREAIHEVLKYIEGIKANKGAKDDEIVVVIVSTTWKELLVPFSSFVKRVKFNVIGYHIDITDDFKILAAKQVTPLELSSDRILSDHHMTYRYLSKSRMQQGIKSISSCFEEKGVDDYLLVILTPPEGEGDRDREAVKAFVKASGLGDKDLHKLVPDYEYMLYSTSMLLSDQEYLSIIDNNSDLKDEFDPEMLDGLEKTDRTNQLYDYAILNNPPFPDSDYAEIGTPAKFSQIYLDGGWKVQQLLRFGKLKANTFLSDDVLIDELKGLAGTNHSLYKKNISNKSLKSLSGIKSEVDNCLQDNPIWRNGVNHALSVIEKELKDTDFDGEIYIYHPSNTILTIYNIITNPDDYESWIPHYHISVKTYNRTLYFFGCLEKNGSASTLEEVITKFYDGDPKCLIFTQIWGGYEPSDYMIAPSYGLEYTNRLIDLSSESNKKQSFKFDGFVNRVSEITHPYRGVMTFIEENRQFCHDVLNFYSSRQLGGGMVIF